MSAEISESMEMPGTIGSARLTFPNDPTVVKGSHLTVTTFPDGKTVLEWDDEALLRDVQKALTEYENSVKVNTTKTKRKKKNEA
jgi:hypothetical protein